MCKTCLNPHPTKDECFKLFYRHEGELYRQALPRSAFSTKSRCTLYNKLANQPVHKYKKGIRIHVLGYGLISIGVINSIMDGKSVADWYHRKKEKKNQHGVFKTRNMPVVSKIDNDEDDSRIDKPIPPRYQKYATIPSKIYKNGFLTLRMRTK